MAPAGGCGRIARSSDAGTFEVRFPGNAASTTLDPAPDGMATVDYANGVFKVTISKPDQQDPPDDVPFSVVVVV